MAEFGKIKKKSCMIMLMFSVACSVRASGDIPIIIPFEKIDYIMYARKDDHNKMLNVYLENRSQFSICIDQDGWPAKGYMDDCVPNKLEVVYGEKKVGFKQSRCSECGLSGEGVPYRPDACEYRILPGKILSGYIKYEEFSEDLSSMRPEEMTLNFPYPANVCEDWKATGQPTPLLPQ